MHESAIDPLNEISRNIDHQHIRYEIKHDVVSIEHLQPRIIASILVGTLGIIINAIIITNGVAVDINMLGIVISADWNFKVEH